MTMSLTSFSSIEHVKVFSNKGPGGDAIATPSIVYLRARIAFRLVEIVGFSRLRSTRHEDLIFSALGFQR